MRTAMADGAGQSPRGLGHWNRRSAAHSRDGGHGTMLHVAEVEAVLYLGVYDDDVLL